MKSAQAGAEPIYSYLMKKKTTTYTHLLPTDNPRLLQVTQHRVILLCDIENKGTLYQIYNVGDF